MTNGYKEVCLNMVDLPITKDIPCFRQGKNRVATALPIPMFAGASLDIGLLGKTAVSVWHHLPSGKLT